MARNVLVDAGFVVALLSSRDNYHQWAVTQASEFPPPWSTCEAVLSESFHLLGGRGAPNLGALVRRRALLVSFEFAKHVEPVVRLIEKYSDVPMKFIIRLLTEGFLVSNLARGANPFHSTNHPCGLLRRSDEEI